MPTDLSQVLVIGVSSRALFNLEKEDIIFKDKGIIEFRKFQFENEDTPLEPGTAYHLIKNLLNLNKIATQQIVEVVVMSRNSPETGVRMLNSLRKLDLDITRVALSGGGPLSPYIEAYDVDLFLSKDEKDVQLIIDSNQCAAATIYSPPESYNSDDNIVKFAFDADAVIFSDESELINKKEGLEAFHRNESENEDIPLNEGPFATLIKKLSKIQEHLPTPIELTPLRIAIVTARNAPSHMRVIKTLRNWGVYVDEAYFLGGLPKHKLLKAFGAHIFFDDQDTHLNNSCKVVPSAKVPYKSGSEMKKIESEGKNN